MKIYVIRHAKTLYNEDELINGSLDDDRLSPAGIAQIPELIAAIEAVDFSDIYTSTMTRAIQTAQPIADHYHKTLIEDKGSSKLTSGALMGSHGNPRHLHLGSIHRVCSVAVNTTLQNTAAKALHTQKPGLQTLSMS